MNWAWARWFIWSLPSFWHELLVEKPGVQIQWSTLREQTALDNTGRGWMQAARNRTCVLRIGCAGALPLISYAQYAYLFSFSNVLSISIKSVFYWSDKLSTWRYDFKCAIAILSLHPEKIRERNANVSAILTREFFVMLRLIFKFLFWVRQNDWKRVYCSSLKVGKIGGKNRFISIY